MTHFYKLGGPNYKDLFSHSSGIQECKIKGSAMLIPPGGCEVETLSCQLAFGGSSHCQRSSPVALSPHLCPCLRAFFILCSPVMSVLFL